MSRYRAPLTKMTFAMTELAGLDKFDCPDLRTRRPTRSQRSSRRRAGSPPTSKIRSTPLATARARAGRTTAA